MYIRGTFIASKKKGKTFMIFDLFSAIAAKGIRARYNPKSNGAILYFHRVLESPDAYYPDDLNQKDFEKLLIELKKEFEIVPLDSVNNTNTKNKKTLLSITFDDGYKDNYSLAIPVLVKHGVPATFFVSSGGIKEGILWQDRLVTLIKKMPDSYFGKRFKLIGKENFGEVLNKFKYLPCKDRDLEIEKIHGDFSNVVFPRMMMTPGELKAISDHELFDIGGHTLQHVILNCELDVVSKFQIEEDKINIEKIIGKKIHLFCYPNGIPDVDFQERHTCMVKSAGYEKAYSTQDGGVCAKSNTLALPRFMPYRKNPKLRALSAIKIAGE